jgi:Uma2 family endonuclease
MTTGSAERRLHTVEEYLRLEREAEERHEFRDGDIVDMAGGSVVHSLLIANCIGTLGRFLKGGPCRVYDSNLRVRIKRRSLYSYPDATIVCGPPQVDHDDPFGETVVNPTLVLEVLSPSTELYNRKTKFDRYRELGSFQEYVLVSQDMPRIETYFRHPDGGWAFDVGVELEAVVKLRSVGVDLPLAEIYAGVDFPPATT